MAKVKAKALRGALAGLPAAVEQLARDLEADQRRAQALGAVVRRAYDHQHALLEERLAGGEFLRGEVMRSWQEFVGAGEVTRWLAGGIGRVRAWLARQFRPRAVPPLQQAKEQAFEELLSALVRAADAAAHHVAADWTADPAGAALLASRPELWGHDPGLEQSGRTLLTAWLGRLTSMVEERGHNRRAFAFAASLGVNALGLIAMLAVFAHSAGLTGGELVIAGGTAAVNQKLLEALIGEAAVADIIRAASRDLRSTLHAALGLDAERFHALLAPPPTAPAALRASAARVADEADRLLAARERA
jgi:hypothetical protein